MKLLVTSAHPTLLAEATPHLGRYQRGGLGRLIQPRHYSSIEQTAESGMPWAADNDAFNDGFDEKAFTTMLDRLKGLPGCLFVAAPDVVGDWESTSWLWATWYPQIKTRRLPVALVAQDGLTSDLTPWWMLDALFIGGTTEWKLGSQAAELVAEANDLGKWTHMGRVNSIRRLAYAEAIGCKSVDGSKWARWRDTYLPGGLAHMRQLRIP